MKRNSVSMRTRIAIFGIEANCIVCVRAACHGGYGMNVLELGNYIVVCGHDVGRAGEYCAEVDQWSRSDRPDFDGR